MHVTVYLICALVTALMAAYGIWRTIRIAHLGTTSKLAVTAFFALAGASHFAFLDMTDLFERAFIVDTLPVTGLFVSFAYWFFLLALARDVIGGVRGLVRRKMGLPVEKRDLFTIVSTCFVAVFGIFFGITSTWNALSEPTVEPMTVAVRNLPPELEGFKVAQITDLHASNLFPAARTEAVVKAVNEAKPDLVLITGDFSDGPLDREAAVLQRDADLAPLSGLKAAYGIFGVTGNHEYIRPEREKLLEIIRRHGVVILENEAVSIAVKGRRVTVAGVDDLAAERTGAGRHDLAGTLSNLADDDLRILMDHQPPHGSRGCEPCLEGGSAAFGSHPRRPHGSRRDSRLACQQRLRQGLLRAGRHEALRLPGRGLLGGLPREKRHLQRNPAHHVHARQLIEQLFEHSRHGKSLPTSGGFFIPQEQTTSLTQRPQKAHGERMHPKRAFG